MDEERFDLTAASVRADASDARALAEALASKLGAALPDHTTVRRRATRLLSREKRVESVAIQLGEDTFSLALEGAGTITHRARTVRGVVIKREELPLDRWLHALDQALAEEAQRSHTARVALEQLLD